tara:strand:+ start:109 stop:525 length:417 start_codon:yes stop_codon:yes gene_type:complete
MGVIHTLGQNYVRDLVFQGAIQGDLYLGLMEEGAVRPVSATLNSGVTEVTGTGYSRILIANNADWLDTIDGRAEHVEKTFNVGSGGWNNVRGWFLINAASGAGAVLFSEIFPAVEQGNQLEGVAIKIKTAIRFKDVTQ